VDCDAATVLLAAAEARTLTVTESDELNHHCEGCAECSELLAHHGDERVRWIATVPEDALDDADLLVLPLVDPSVFLSEGELARGGMGRITRVRDRRLARDIAIKEVISPAMRARFEREVMITAQLQHPAIIPVYEAGVWPNGNAFYAMRLVSGGTLAEAIGKTRSLEERLALIPNVLAVTDALAYAHAKRIVHRDLKPGNVLVGEFGETVVIDWGLAKELDRDIADVADNAVPARPSDLTMAGSVIGTPGFLSPEQALGGEIDERTDVYALGGIMYNVLAGHPPYLDRPGQTAETLIALARDQPPTPLETLVPRAPRDLCAIVDRAMARDRAARYPTAKEMADELRRFEAGQLLRSREYRLGELVARWLRRHRAAVSVGAIAMAVLAVVGFTSVREIVRRERAAELALARGRLEHGRELLVGGDPSAAAPYLAAAVERLPDDEVARKLATIALRDAERLRGVFRGTAAAFDPEGKYLAIGRDDGSILLVDPATTADIAVLPARGGAITHLEVTGKEILTASPAGAYLGWVDRVALAKDDVEDARAAGDAIALGTPSGVRLVRRDGSPIASADATNAWPLDVSPDGHLLLACAREHTFVWSLPDLARVAELPASPEARFDGDGGVVIYDPTVGLVRYRLAAPASAIVLRRGEGPRPRRIAGGLAAGTELVDLVANTTHSFAPAVAASEIASIDPRHVITAGYDRAVRIWDLDRPARPLAILRAAQSTAQIVIDRAGTRAATVGYGGKVDLWDITALRAPVIAARLSGNVGNLDVAGGQLAAWVFEGGADRTVVLDAADKPMASASGWLAGTVGHDGIAVLSNGELAIYDARDGTRRHTILDPAPIQAAAISPSSAIIATRADRRITLRDARTAATLGGFDLPAVELAAIALDDAGHVVTGHDDGTVRIWDARAGVMTATLRGHTSKVSVIAIRGDRLLTVSWDQTARTWSFPAGQPKATVLSRAGKAALSPDGRWLATVEHDAIASAWDVDEGRLIEQFAASEPLDAVTFVDATHLAVGGTGGAVETIDLAERTRSDDEISRVAARLAGASND
jgi:eukaryotic-like serine/threonine-protein kinase